jgi:hypothetical protein
MSQPIISEQKVIDVYNTNREALINQAKRYLGGLFELVEIEEIVEDVFYRSLLSPQMKKGFNDIKHISRYLFKSVTLESKMKAKYKILELKYPPITQKELDHWYQFTRDFFDSVLRKKDYPPLADVKFY